MQRLSVASVIANSRADESAPASPSVTSVQDVVTDIQRRKSGATARTLARRLRIEKRALIGKRRRDAGGSDSNDEKEKSLLERQLDGSSSILNLLIEDGKELINNVSVGNNVREQRRNNEHSEAHSRRMQALEEEARLAEEKFQEINSKWRIIESFNDPLDINNASQVQREKCEELINQKNTIIAMLKKELEYEDFRFTADQEVQLNDVSILVERIDNQINIMRRAYKNQLILIESAIDTERFESMERNRKQWELLNKENEKGEVSYIETRLEKIEEHETSMIITTIEYEEKCRQLKMSLESDIQVMQQKLEELKTKCLLNSEKLNYDYHILRKRDEENISIKAQQKRKINKLQEEITNLYQTLKDLTYLSEEEILKVNGESSSLQSNIENAIKKMNHFLYMNNKKYTDLWKFNVMEAKQLMSEILSIDRSIHEQQLNCPWIPPDSSPLSDEFDVLAKKICGSQDARSDDCDIYSSAVNGFNAHQKKMAKLILEKLCDETGFLLDKNIENLLATYPPEKRILVKLETIFKMLGINSEEDIKALKRYFLPYAVCTDCSQRQMQFEAVNRKALVDKKKFQTSSLPNLCALTDDEKWKLLHPSERKAVSDSNLNCWSSEDKKVRLLDPAKEKPKSSCFDELHSFDLEPANVLKGLTDFIQHFHANKTTSTNYFEDDAFFYDQSSFKMTSLPPDDVKKYWEQVQSIFAKDREQLWNALTVGLSKYFKILKDRQKVRSEIHILEKENKELKKLLGKHLGQSKVKTAPSKSCFPPLQEPRAKSATIINYTLFEEFTNL
ncbi:unnamed protein product [Bemisia tabaci]|uniref:Dynein regulatory complex protein 1 n=1 Tax=Bemisia tabaci TaxID=7038 RepID=A0A9P0F5Y4_BEMTA|nr:unnamed protein product [Bemisia tabaci]